MRQCWCTALGLLDTLQVGLCRPLPDERHQQVRPDCKNTLCAAPPAPTLTRPPAPRIAASARDVPSAPKDHISEKIPPRGPLIAQTTCLGSLSPVAESTHPAMPDSLEPLCADTAGRRADRLALSDRIAFAVDHVVRMTPEVSVFAHGSIRGEGDIRFRQHGGASSCQRRAVSRAVRCSRRTR